MSLLPALKAWKILRSDDEHAASLNDVESRLIEQFARSKQPGVVTELLKVSDAAFAAAIETVLNQVANSRLPAQGYGNSDATADARRSHRWTRGSA